MHGGTAAGAVGGLPVTRPRAAGGPILAAVDTVDAYVAAQPAEVRARLAEIRRRIHAAVPGAGEAIRYRMPTIMLDGGPLVHFAAWKRHIAFYPVPDGDEAFARDIAPYRGAKDAAQFRHAEPIPYELVDRLVGHLVAARAR